MESNKEGKSLLTNQISPLLKLQSLPPLPPHLVHDNKAVNKGYVCGPTCQGIDISYPDSTGIIDQEMNTACLMQNTQCRNFTPLMETMSSGQGNVCYGGGNASTVTFKTIVYQQRIENTGHHLGFHSSISNHPSAWKRRNSCPESRCSEQQEHAKTYYRTLQQTLMRHRVSSAYSKSSGPFDNGGMKVISTCSPQGESSQTIQSSINNPNFQGNNHGSSTCNLNSSNEKSQIKVPVKDKSVVNNGNGDRDKQNDQYKKQVQATIHGSKDFPATSETSMYLPQAQVACQICDHLPQIPVTSTAAKHLQQMQVASTADKPFPQTQGTSTAAKHLKQMQVTCTEATYMPQTQRTSTVAKHVPQMQLNSTAAKHLSQMQGTSTATKHLPQMQVTNTAAKCLPQMQVTSTAAKHLPQMQVTSTAAKHLPQMQVISTAAKHLPKTQTICKAAKQLPQMQLTSTAAKHLPQMQVTSTAAKHLPQMQVTSTAAKHLPKTQTNCKTAKQLPQTQMTSIVSNNLPQTRGTTTVSKHLPQIQVSNVAYTHSPQIQMTSTTPKHLQHTQVTNVRSKYLPQIQVSHTSSKYLSPTPVTDVAHKNPPQTQVPIIAVKYIPQTQVTTKLKYSPQTQVTSITTEHLPQTRVTSSTTKQLTQTQKTRTTAKHLSKARVTNTEATDQVTTEVSKCLPQIDSITTTVKHLRQVQRTSQTSRSLPQVQVTTVASKNMSPAQVTCNVSMDLPQSKVSANASSDLLESQTSEHLHKNMKSEGRYKIPDKLPLQKSEKEENTLNIKEVVLKPNESFPGDRILKHDQKESCRSGKIVKLFDKDDLDEVSKTMKSKAIKFTTDNLVVCSTHPGASANALKDISEETDTVKDNITVNKNENLQPKLKKLGHISRTASKSILTSLGNSLKSILISKKVAGKHEDTKTTNKDQLQKALKMSLHKKSEPALCVSSESKTSEKNNKNERKSKCSENSEQNMESHGIQAEGFLQILKKKNTFEKLNDVAMKVKENEKRLESNLTIGNCTNLKKTNKNNQSIFEKMEESKNLCEEVTARSREFNSFSESVTNPLGLVMQSSSPVQYKENFICGNDFDLKELHNKTPVQPTSSAIIELKHHTYSSKKILDIKEVNCQKEIATKRKKSKRTGSKMKAKSLKNSKSVTSGKSVLRAETRAILRTDGRNTTVLVEDSMLNEIKSSNENLELINKVLNESKQNMIPDRVVDLRDNNTTEKELEEESYKITDMTETFYHPIALPLGCHVCSDSENEEDVGKNETKEDVRLGKLMAKMGQDKYEHYLGTSTTFMPWVLHPIDRDKTLMRKECEYSSDDYEGNIEPARSIERPSSSEGYFYPNNDSSDEKVFVDPRIKKKQHMKVKYQKDNTVELHEKNEQKNDMKLSSDVQTNTFSGSSATGISIEGNMDGITIAYTTNNRNLNPYLDKIKPMERECAVKSSDQPRENVSDQIRIYKTKTRKDFSDKSVEHPEGDQEENGIRENPPTILPVELKKIQVSMKVNDEKVNEQNNPLAGIANLLTEKLKLSKVKEILCPVTKKKEEVPPVKTACVPVKTTCVPVKTTCVPVKTTCVPIEATCVPVKTTCVPVKTTCLSVEATCVPIKTTCVPFKTTCVPVKTTCVPIEATCVPVKTTCVPVKTTCLPVETICVPVETTCVPIEATCMPVKTTCVPVKTTCLPVETICVPVETTCVPIEATCMPVKTTCVPVKTTCESTPGDKSSQVQITEKQMQKENENMSVSIQKNEKYSHHLENSFSYTGNVLNKIENEFKRKETASSDVINSQCLVTVALRVESEKGSSMINARSSPRHTAVDLDNCEQDQNHTFIKIQKKKVNRIRETLLMKESADFLGDKFDPNSSRMRSNFVPKHLSDFVSGSPPLFFKDQGKNTKNKYIEENGDNKDEMSGRKGSPEKGTCRKNDSKCLNNENSTVTSCGSKRKLEKAINVDHCSEDNRTDLKMENEVDDLENIRMSCICTRNTQKKLRTEVFGKQSDGKNLASSEIKNSSNTSVSSQEKKRKGRPPSVSHISKKENIKHPGEMHTTTKIKAPNICQDGSKMKKCRVELSRTSNVGVQKCLGKSGEMNTKKNRKVSNPCQDVSKIKKCRVELSRTSNVTVPKHLVKSDDMNITKNIKTSNTCQGGRKIKKCSVELPRPSNVTAQKGLVKSGEMYRTKNRKISNASQNDNKIKKCRVELSRMSNVTVPKSSLKNAISFNTEHTHTVKSDWKFGKTFPKKKLKTSASPKKKKLLKKFKLLQSTSCRSLQKPKKKFPCQKVRFRVVTDRAVQKEAKKKRPVSCKYCRKMVPHNLLLNHVKQSHPFRCYCCRRLFASRDEKKRHNTDIHDAEQARYHCGSCDRTFSTPFHMEVHCKSGAHNQQRNILLKKINMINDVLYKITGLFTNRKRQGQIEGRSSLPSIQSSQQAIIPVAEKENSNLNVSLVHEPFVSFLTTEQDLKKRTKDIHHEEPELRQVIKDLEMLHYHISCFAPSGGLIPLHSDEDLMSTSQQIPAIDKYYSKMVTYERAGQSIGWHSGTYSDKMHDVCNQPSHATHNGANDNCSEIPMLSCDTGNMYPSADVGNQSQCPGHSSIVPNCSQSHCIDNRLSAMPNQEQTDGWLSKAIDAIQNDPPLDFCNSMLPPHSYNAHGDIPSSNTVYESSNKNVPFEISDSILDVPDVAFNSRSCLSSAGELLMPSSTLSCSEGQCSNIPEPVFTNLENVKENDLQNVYDTSISLKQPMVQYSSNTLSDGMDSCNVSESGQFGTGCDHHDNHMSFSSSLGDEVWNDGFGKDDQNDDKTCMDLSESLIPVTHNTDDDIFAAEGLIAMSRSLHNRQFEKTNSFCTPSLNRDMSNLSSTSDIQETCSQKPPDQAILLSNNTQKELLTDNSCVSSTRQMKTPYDKTNCNERNLHTFAIANKDLTDQSKQQFAASSSLNKNFTDGNIYIVPESMSQSDGDKNILGKEYERILSDIKQYMIESGEFKEYL